MAKNVERGVALGRVEQRPKRGAELKRLVSVSYSALRSASDNRLTPSAISCWLRAP
jgi:hypothetical protein